MTRPTPLSQGSFGTKSQPHDFELLTRSDIERFEFFRVADCFCFDGFALEGPRPLRVPVPRVRISRLREHPDRRDVNAEIAT